MISIKVKFRPSTTIGKEETIYYQFIHKRVIRQLKTDYRIYADEWNEKNHALIIINYWCSINVLTPFYLQNLIVDKPPLGRFERLSGKLKDENYVKSFTGHQ